jgi:hypothetical protein
VANHEIILELEHPSRLDLALLSELKKSYPALSRAKLKEWFKLDLVLQKGRPASASLELGVGQHRIEIPHLPQASLEMDVAKASKNGCFLDPEQNLRHPFSSSFRSGD